MRNIFGIILATAFVVLLSACCQGSEIRLQLNAINAYFPDGYRGIEETEILSLNPDANTGGNWDMMVGSDEDGGLHRLLVRWNIDKLEPLFKDENMTILTVKMRLGEWYNKNKPNQEIGVYRILPANKNWVVGTTGAYTWNTPQPGAVTWNEKISGEEKWAGSVGCGTPGVDYDPNPVAIFHSDSDTQGMWPRYMPAFDLPIKLARQWAENPDENAGLLIKSIDETGDNFVYVIGSEHQREDYGWHLHHPELVVMYMNKNTVNMKAPGYVVKAGKPCVVILTPNNASFGEQYAASELANHIQQISGAEIIQIEEDRYKPEYGPFISIGRTKASIKHLDSKKFGALGDEGYNIFEKNGNLYFIGGKKRGSLYAVYDYLESLGVRWYSPDYSAIPQKLTLKMPQKPVTYVPKFWYRDQYWNNPTTKEWMARMRTNGEYSRIPDDMGGSSHTLYGCHSFLALIPPEEYFDKHPEWFAVKEDGRRSKTEYCLTDQSLRDYVRDRVISEVKSTEGWAEYIWVSQNDGSLSGCFCDKCTAQRIAHGGKDIWSANTISFVNYVADAMAEQFSKVKVKTLAYSYTTEPPSNMKVADNISIELCGNFGAGEKDKHTNLAKSWSKIASNIEVYTYGGSNFGYWWPFPNIWEMGAQYSRALDAGVSAFYVQGTAAGRGSGMVDLRAYLSARLAWDPSRDIKKEVKSFCDGFYGPAGKYVYEYIRWYSAYTKRHKMEVEGGWGDADKWRGWVTKEAMNYSDSLFKRAMEAVKDNPTYLNHVRRAYLEVIWGSIMVNLSEKPQIVDGDYLMVAADKAGELAEKTSLFNQIMAENNYNMMSEPVAYVPGRSQLDAVSANYGAVELSNESCQLWVVPSLGGRIILWNVDKLGSSVFRRTGGSDPYSAGYEEVSSIPIKMTKYENISVSKLSVVMKGAVDKNVESTRTFTLDPEKPLLHIASEYTNVSDQSITIAVGTHPEFAFNLFGKSKLYTMNEGKWSSQSLWTKKNPEGSTYVDMGQVNMGTWILGDSAKNIGIVNRFELSEIQTMYTYHGEDYGGINMELWSKSITLLPGKSWRLEHSYEITFDLASALESEK